MNGSMIQQMMGMPAQSHMLGNNPRIMMERQLEKGAKLAESKWGKYCSEFKSPGIKANMALMLENTEEYFKSIDETTRAQQIGNFDKFAFPLIRAIFPNLIAQEIVSVQTMSGPISLVFYLDFLFGSNKGKIQAGQSAFDAISGPADSRFYSSEDIDKETLFTGDGVATVFTGNLAYTPVQPGTIMIEAGSIIGYDNGSGTVAGTGITTATVDSTTGAYSITYAVAPPLGTVGYATYRYDSEANDNIALVDLQLTSSPVTARHRKLRTRWSIEAQAALKSLHNLEAQAELAAFTAEEIRFEIDREVINDLFNIALAGEVDWSITVPSGISYTEHKLSFIDAVIEQSNLVYSATRRGQTNFIITSVDVSNIIESLPTFVAEPGALSTQASTGVVKTGTLNNRWQTYKDPFIGADLANRRVWMAGYKGKSWLDAGYCYAPYLPLYATPTIYLDDFVGRKGLGTAYGKRAINPRYYSTGKIVD